jgi:hypothetical protein
LAAGLNSIGFIGTLPSDVTDQLEPAVLLNVIEAIKTREGIDSPARYFNWLLRQGPGAVHDFLNTLTDSVVEPAALMDTQVYLALRAQHPAWDAQVHATAQQLAEQTGARLDLRVILQAAATTPLPIEEAQ